MLTSSRGSHNADRGRGCIQDTLSSRAARAKVSCIQGEGVKFTKILLAKFFQTSRIGVSSTRRLANLVYCLINDHD